MSFAETVSDVLTTQEFYFIMIQLTKTRKQTGCCFNCTWRYWKILSPTNMRLKSIKTDFWSDFASGSRWRTFQYLIFCLKYIEYSEDWQHVHNVMINRNLEECKIIFGHKMQLLSNKYNCIMQLLGIFIDNIFISLHQYFKIK